MGRQGNGKGGIHKLRNVQARFATPDAFARAQGFIYPYKCKARAILSNSIGCDRGLGPIIDARDNGSPTSPNRRPLSALLVNQRHTLTGACLTLSKSDRAQAMPPAGLHQLPGARGNLGGRDMMRSCL